MDFQLILVFGLFAIAVLFILRIIYLNVKPSKNGGACKSCNACSDLSSIEEPSIEIKK